MNALERSPSAIILVRHGETTYSNSFPDLTDKGRAQIEQTAVRLKPLVAEFDRVIALSSPAVRAMESRQIFLNALGISALAVKESDCIRPSDIKDLNGFLVYDKANSTPRYGQMWLTDPYLGEDNPLIESRFSVENRASRFLTRYASFLANMSHKKSERYLMLATTHFEVMAPIMKAIYTDLPSFPIETEDAPYLGEEVVVYIDQPERCEYRVSARGKLQSVIYNPKTRCFAPRS